MIDIEETDKKVKQVDNLLTTITSVLKKHWLVLIFLSVIGIGYWVFTLPETTEIPVDDNIGTVDQDLEYSTDTIVDQDLEQQDSTFDDQGDVNQDL